jgi:hypothetical protein
VPIGNSNNLCLDVLKNLPSRQRYFIGDTSAESTAKKARFSRVVNFHVADEFVNSIFLQQCGPNQTELQAKRKWNEIKRHNKGYHKIFKHRERVLPSSKLQPTTCNLISFLCVIDLSLVSLFVGMSLRN